jgi:cytochrome P450
MMAMYPVIQEKAFQEIHAFLSSGEPIKDGSFKNLPYLDMVVKETLRLMSSIPLIGRETMTDFDLGPCIIKPGMIVVINIFSLHRSKEIWGEDAEEFRPERFALELFEKVDPYAFIPFSGGARNCVGEKKINKLCNT